GLVSQPCPEVAGLPLLAPPSATGDGLRLASAVGAQTRGLDRCEVTALFALPAQLEVPTTLLAGGAILVNQAGRRFADEGIGSLALAAPVRAQPGPDADRRLGDRTPT